VAMDFFSPGSTLLHRFDPRAKLLLLIAVTACFFLPLPLEVLAAYVGALSALVGFSLGWRQLGKSLLAIAPLLLVICLFTPLFRAGGRVIWAPFGLAYLTSDGASATARLLARFTGITLGFFAAFRTIELDELILTLRWYGLPYRSTLILTIALRFIPSLAEVYANVRDAHTLRRGVESGKRPFERLIPVLTSMIIQAVRGIPTLAMVLELRGFGRANRRTEYRTLGSAQRLARHLAVGALLAAVLFAPLALPR
jgi:energy-coupling factor transport system permease protein